MTFFSHRQLHKFTVYTSDGEDLPKGPSPSGGDLGKCRLENNIFLFKISCICKQFKVYPLFKKLKK